MKSITINTQQNLIRTKHVYKNSAYISGHGFQPILKQHFCSVFFFQVQLERHLHKTTEHRVSHNLATHNTKSHDFTQVLSLFIQSQNSVKLYNKKLQ